MKHFILPTALAVALAGSIALAQTAPAQQTAPATPDTQPAARHHHDGGDHARDPHAIADHISKKLNLTPDQTAKLEPIIADRQQKIAAIRANTTLTPDQRHEQIRAIHESSKQQFASILTPEQLQQLKTMHHDHEHGHHNGANPNPNPAS